MNTKRKARLATVWLDGCSGCHMSFLDLDERLLDIAAVADLVYSPLVDRKDFPTDVDVTLVEGAVSSAEDEHKITLVRERTRYLVAFGDCAVTGNVPSMRNPIGPRAILERTYLENVTQPRIPDRVVPVLLARVRPVHQVVPVDLTLPGCPPSPDLIARVVLDLIAGRMPDLGGISWFGR